jgi:hypothetical protein
MENLLLQKESPPTVTAVEAFMCHNPLGEVQLRTADMFPTVVAFIMDYVVSPKGASHSKDSTPSQKIEVQQSKASSTSKQETAKADTERTSYALVYYNPELKKAEVVEGSVSITYEDETEQAIEESLAQRSAYDLYNHVVAPMMVEKINLEMIHEIESKTKIEPAPPFSGGSAVKIGGKKAEIVVADTKELAGQNKADIVAESIDATEPLAKETARREHIVADPKFAAKYGDAVIAIQVCEKRQEQIIQRLDEHIALTNEALAEIKKNGANTAQIIAILPPLCRARAAAAYKHSKKAKKKNVEDFLAKDSQFLTAVRSKMKTLGPIGLFKALLHFS